MMRIANLFDHLPECDNIANAQERKKYLYIGWVTFAVYAIIFSVVFIIEYKQGLHVNVGYFLCSSLSILIGLYALLNIKRIFQKYSMALHVLNLCLLHRLKAMEYKQHLMDRQTVLAKLAQIKEDQSDRNIELKTQLIYYKRWSKVMADDRWSKVMTSKQVERIIKKRKNSNIFEQITDNLFKQINRKQLEICQIEKNILFKQIYNIIANGSKRNEGYINIIDFDDYISLWPYRYRQQYIESGKSFIDFLDISGDIVNNNILCQFIEQIVANEVKNAFSFMANSINSKIFRFS